MGHSSDKTISHGVFEDIFVFMVPTMKCFEFTLLGTLFLTEVILLVFLVCAIATSRVILDSKMARAFILLCLLWLFGQMLTDIIRNIQFVDYSRGWAKIGFTIINFAGIYVLLYRKPRFILLFAAGISIGGVGKYLLSPGIYAHVYPWKFGVGTPLTVLFILAVAAVPQRHILFRGLLLGGISLFNLAMGFRSMAGICALTAVYLALQWLCSHSIYASQRVSFGRVIALFCALLAASIVLINGYGYAARQGLLGDNARQLYEDQAYGLLGVLIGGRSEILVAGRAIVDAPLIGHGSWAKDEKYSDAFVELRQYLGYGVAVAPEENLIPTHSHLFGAWVEAGAAGAIFWVWLLYLPLRCLAMMARAEEPLTPLFAFICFILIWDIFFSPYAGDRRFIMPFYAVVLMRVVARINRVRDARINSHHFL
jgi:hypothetical protein